MWTTKDGSLIWKLHIGWTTSKWARTLQWCTCACVWFCLLIEHMHVHVNVHACVLSTCMCMRDMEDYTPYILNMMCICMHSNSHTHTLTHTHTLHSGGTRRCRPCGWTGRETQIIRSGSLHRRLGQNRPAHCPGHVDVGPSLSNN